MSGQTPAPTVGDAAEGSLRKPAAKAVTWSFVGSTGKQGVRFVFVLFLARLVGPEDFGITAQAMTFVTFVSLFLDQGIGTTLIQRLRLDQVAIATLFWLNAATTGVMVLLTFFGAPLIADFFGPHQLEVLIRVLAIDVLFLGFDVIPRAMLSRELRFRSLALAEVGGAVIGGIAGVAAALSVEGYWALVVQTIVADAAITIMLVILAPKPPMRRGSFRVLRDLLGFSSRVLGSTFLGYAARNLDNVFVGKYLGATPLALYSLSYRTLMVPIISLSQVTNRVALPVYARVQDDLPRVRRAYLESNRLIALVAFPLMLGVLVEAPRGVPLLFGDVWKPAVVPMQILAITGMRQAVQSTLGPLLYGLGRADWALRWSLGTTALYVVSFIIGLKWGITGVAAGYTIAGFLAAPVAVWMSGRLAQFTLRQYGAVLAPAFVGSLAFAGVAYASGAGLDALGVPAAVVLLLTATVGVVTYVGVLRLVWPHELRELKGFTNIALRR
jgi:PST family polysaccharide transporter